MTNIRPLSKELQAQAIVELNEVPSRLDEDIAALRSWIEKQPHLKARTDDQFLVTFLRGCKFSIEKAKDKIDKFYTLQTIYEKTLTWREIDHPMVSEVLDLGIVLVLPKPLGENGPRILFGRPCHYSPDKYNMTDISRIMTTISSVLLKTDDRIVVSGFIQIIDFSDMTPAHFLQFNPMFMKRFSIYTEEALPCRNCGSHFFNTPPGFETMFHTFRRILSPKMQERLYMHGNSLESLYKMVPQQYFPKEYGGKNGTIHGVTEYWKRAVLDNRNYLKENNLFRTNEHLRVGKRIDFDSVFGAEGSFRKLSIE